MKINVPHGASGFPVSLWNTYMLMIMYFKQPLVGPSNVCVYHVSSLLRQSYLSLLAMTCFVQSTMRICWLTMGIFWPDMFLLSKTYITKVGRPWHQQIWSSSVGNYSGFWAPKLDPWYSYWNMNACGASCACCACWLKCPLLPPVLFVSAFNPNLLIVSPCWSPHFIEKLVLLESFWSYMCCLYNKTCWPKFCWVEQKIETFLRDSTCCRFLGQKQVLLTEKETGVFFLLEIENLSWWHQNHPQFSGHFRNQTKLEVPTICKV